MHDPLGIPRHLANAFSTAEKVRRLAEPSQGVRDSIDAAMGGAAMKHLRDLTALNTPNSSVSGARSALEFFRDAKLIDPRKTFGLHDLPLKSLIGQLDAKPPWFGSSITAAPAGLMKNAIELAGFGHAQRLLADLTDPTSLEKRAIEQHAESVRAIEAMLKPALETSRPIQAVVDRLGLGSMRLLKDLWEPAGLRVAHEAFARIQSEQAAFAASFSTLRSPWTGIDWIRMQQLVENEADAEVNGESDAWSDEDISAEDEEAFTNALRPVLEAIATVAASSKQRDAKQTETIARLIAVHESLSDKPRLWARVLRKILEVIVLALVMEWAGSHTTPMIDRALSLLNQPVSTVQQPSAIRRDAADAVREIDISEGDVRYLRVVVRRVLPVLSEPKPGVVCAHELHSGQIVALVEWDKKWRRIEWRDSATGDLRSGWVRAKYIARIGR